MNTFKDSHQYLEGRRAYYQGRDITDNPHFIDEFTDTKSNVYWRHVDWDAGFSEADFDANDISQ